MGSSENDEAVPAAQQSAQYLEEFTESISELPADLNKNLSLMGELDTRANEAFEVIKERAAKCMRRAKGGQADDIKKQIWDQLAQEHSECIDIADEKVALAEQTYELVDGHVRRLDAVLKKFESELRQIDPDRLAELKVAAVQPDPFHAAGIHPAGGGPGSGGNGAGANRKRKGHSADGGGVGTGGGRSGVGGNKMNIDVPVDPNEPRYCYCQQVSYGEMVACDNDQCPHEWFHYACVDLSAPPTGEWMCPPCTKAAAAAAAAGKQSKKK